MLFTEYMNSLPDIKSDTMRKIAVLTSSSMASVYRWVNGTSCPPLVKQKIIADFLNMNTEDLFPNEKEV